MKSTSRSRKNSPAASRPESPTDKALDGVAGLALEALEARVHSAIEEIERLRRDNADLRSRADSSAASTASADAWVREREELRQRVTHLVERLEALARVEDTA
jgi:FtsZ-binding cell division protein ZapB